MTFRKPLRILLAINLLTCFCGNAQSDSTNYLIGKWESTAKDHSGELNFLDSNQVIFDFDNIKPLQNRQMPYRIDKIKDQLIFVIQLPGTLHYQMKLLLWKINNDEIKILAVDDMYNDDPLKFDATKNMKRAITFKREILYKNN
jgi:hypothetical protein